MAAVFAARPPRLLYAGGIQVLSGMRDIFTPVFLARAGRPFPGPSGGAGPFVFRPLALLRSSACSWPCSCSKNTAPPTPAWRWPWPCSSAGSFLRRQGAPSTATRDLRLPARPLPHPQRRRCAPFPRSATSRSLLLLRAARRRLGGRRRRAAAERPRRGQRRLPRLRPRRPGRGGRPRRPAAAEPEFFPQPLRELSAVQEDPPDRLLQVGAAGAA